MKVLGPTDNKFADFAQHMSDVVFLPDTLRDDLNVIFMWHTDVEDGVVMAKTVGKMFRQAVCPEGLFTYVLQSKKITNGEGGIDFMFQVLPDESSTVKTPMGLFNDKYVPNDLQMVLDKIKAYNEGE